MNESDQRMPGHNDVSALALSDLAEDSYAALATANIQSGRQGALRLHPDVFWLPVSENCNLKCIGCDDVLNGFRKEYLSPEEVRRILSSGSAQATFSEIDLTGGEALLHPQLAAVIAVCRELHPGAKISVISNGTVPVKGRYKEAYRQLDSVGLSIDGASKDVFEAVRVGANFEHFVANAKDLIALKAATGYPKEIQLCFTACALNLHELADVVRLGAAWGVDSVFAQTMEMNVEGIRTAIGHLHLDLMDPELRSRLMDQAQAAAEDTGMKFWPSDGLYPQTPITDLPDTHLAAPGPSLAFERKVAELGVGVTRSPAKPQEPAGSPHVHRCQYPWTQAPGIVKKAGQWGMVLCCYLSEQANAELLARYPFGDVGKQSMLDIFNGPGYWQFRADLLANKTLPQCGNCSAALTHAPSPYQQLALQLQSRCALAGVPFPGDAALWRHLNQDNPSAQVGTRLLRHLEGDWSRTHWAQTPDWLAELIVLVRAETAKLA